MSTSKIAQGQHISKAESTSITFEEVAFGLAADKGDVTALRQEGNGKWVRSNCPVRLEDALTTPTVVAYRPELLPLDVDSPVSASAVARAAQALGVRAIGTPSGTVDVDGFAHLTLVAHLGTDAHKRAFAKLVEIFGGRGVTRRNQKTRLPGSAAYKQHHRPVERVFVELQPDGTTARLSPLEAHNALATPSPVAEDRLADNLQVYAPAEPARPVTAPTPIGRSDESVAAMFRALSTESRALADTDGRGLRSWAPDSLSEAEWKVARELLVARFSDDAIARFLSETQIGHRMRERLNRSNRTPVEYVRGIRKSYLKKFAEPGCSPYQKGKGTGAAESALAVALNRLWQAAAGTPAGLVSLAALIDLAARSGKTDLGASSRQLALMTGLSQAAAPRALAKMPSVRVLSRGDETLEAIYEMLLPDECAPISTHTRPSPATLLALTGGDLGHGRRTHGGRVLTTGALMALAVIENHTDDDTELTAVTVARVWGATSQTARAWVEELLGVGLVDHHLDLYERRFSAKTALSRTDLSHAAAATALGITGAAERVRAAIDDERADHNLRLAERAFERAAHRDKQAAIRAGTRAHLEALAGDPGVAAPVVEALTVAPALERIATTLHHYGTTGDSRVRVAEIAVEAAKGDIDEGTALADRAMMVASIWQTCRGDVPTDAQLVAVAAQAVEALSTSGDVEVVEALLDAAATAGAAGTPRLGVAPEQAPAAEPVPILEAPSSRPPSHQVPAGACLQSPVPVADTDAIEAALHHVERRCSVRKLSPTKIAWVASQAGEDAPVGTVLTYVRSGADQFHPTWTKAGTCVQLRREPEGWVVTAAWRGARPWATDIGDIHVEQPVRELASVSLLPEQADSSRSMTHSLAA